MGLSVWETPSSMPSRKPPPAPPRQVILEDIRSQNRATIEAVEVRAREVKNELTQFREQTSARLEAIEAAVRQNSTDIRHLGAKVDRVAGLEDRVAILERRRA